MVLIRFDYSSIGKIEKGKTIYNLHNYPAIQTLYSSNKMFTAKVKKLDNMARSYRHRTLLCPIKRVLRQRLENSLAVEKLEFLSNLFVGLKFLYFLFFICVVSVES